MNINDRVLELVESGTPVSKIRAFLTIEDYSAKDIGIALKEADLIGKRATFRGGFWDFIVDDRPTLEEAEKYLDDWVESNPEKSSNIVRHRNTFLNEAKLAIRIRANLES